MKKYGLAVKYSNSIKECLVIFSKSGVKISNVYIPTENIESIVFSNENPQTDMVYSACINQVYCYINYRELNETNTVIIKPITNFWSSLMMLCPDKFIDLTNGKAAKLSFRIVYGDKFEPNHKVINTFKILGVVLIVVLLFSFFIQKKIVDWDIQTKIPLPFLVMIVIVLSYSIFIFKFYKKKE